MATIRCIKYACGRLVCSHPDDQLHHPHAEPERCADCRLYDKTQVPCEFKSTPAEDSIEMLPPDARKNVLRSLAQVKDRMSKPLDDSGLHILAQNARGKNNENKAVQ